MAEGVDLPEMHQHLLKSHMALLDEVRLQVRATEEWIDRVLSEHPLRELVDSFPGVGKILSALMSLEIDQIERFPSASRFASYCGLVCSTYSSGGKTYHGGLIPSCNRYLRYAFIEASWTAVQVSPYFRSFYQRLKTRKTASVAIVAVARKMAEIMWVCLKNKRKYQEKVYRFGRVALSKS